MITLKRPIKFQLFMENPRKRLGNGSETVATVFKTFPKKRFETVFKPFPKRFLPVSKRSQNGCKRCHFASPDPEFFIYCFRQIC